ncbi:MAG TPA: putative metalloprotease CJM1_0395 family protein [Rhodocyclaceae bacterium]
MSSAVSLNPAASSAAPRTAAKGPGGAAEAPGAGKAKQELNPAQQRQVARLQQVDKNVRAHEQAHIAAGQGLVRGGPTYSYTYGPDGKQYATGGEVGIDTSPARKPEDNIQKGRQIQAAALAPADPSPQDYRVAAAGLSLEQQGRAEQAAQRRDGSAEGQGDAARQRVEKAYAGAPAPSTFSAFA